MRKLSMLIFCLFLTACGGGGDDGPPPSQGPQQTGPLKVFIFAGQSNMLGADATIAPTFTDDMAATGQQQASDRQARFTMATPTLSYPWGDIRGHNGVMLGSETHKGLPVKVHGPEVGFSRAMGQRVAIIKYSDNFDALENNRSPWVKPGTRWTAWQAFVDQQLAAIGEPYEVAGFIWLQGIDDGKLNRGEVEYRTDLVQIVADLRAKFGNKPFILGRSIPSPVVGAAMTPIRWGQELVGVMPGNSIVDLDDLGPWVGDHHLNAAAQLTSGSRFATAYKSKI